jgi:predicted hydrocarbon binding protein
MTVLIHHTIIKNKNCIYKENQIMKKYNFQWKDLGDMEQGRPNLGLEAPVVMYRLMQYAFKDVLSGELGLEETGELFAQAGELAGRAFCQNILNTNLTLSEFIAHFAEKLIELKVGILRVESADMEKMLFTVTISEDLDCSGLPVLGGTVCDYDEGFIAGVLKEFTGRTFNVKETDCWATGERTCRFDIKPDGK